MNNTTLYLIAYDIPNDRRRTKIHKTLCGFGEWTQYSFFECFLNHAELIALRHRLNHILDPAEDNLRIYPVCKACQAAVESIGSVRPVEKTIYLV